MHVQHKEKNLERLLKDAVESGKIVYFQHIKIFLTGSSAAGKTSLRNSLFNDDFEKEHKPTRLQETRHAYVASILESKDGDVKWLVLTPEQQISHFKRLLETERPKNLEKKDTDTQTDTSEGINFEPTKKLEKQLHDSKGLAPCSEIPDPKNSIPVVEKDADVESLVLTPEQRLLETQRPKNMEKKEIDPQTDTSKSINFEPSKKLEKQLHDSKGLAPHLKVPDPANLITLVDTGGQPEYIHMLPAIVNCSNINFVVIDMTKKLTDKVEVYDKSKDKNQMKQENRVTVEIPCDQEEDKLKEEDKVEVVHYRVKKDEINETQKKENKINVKVHYKVIEEDEVKNENIVEVGIHYKSKKPLYSLDYTYDELIKLLMSVTSYSKACEEHDDSNPYPGGTSFIGFVGTHKDKADHKTRDKLTKELNELVKKQDCLSLLNGDDYLFQVDNTKSGSDKKDPEVVKIRKEIKTVIDRRIKKYPVPITWMILEIQVKSIYETRNFITFDEFTKIANEEVSIKSDEDVKSVLRYFNQLGIFLHFDEVPKMQKYVIIDHQWFYSILCTLMKRLSDSSSNNDSASKERYKKGQVLKEDLLSMKLDDKIETESLVELFCHMKIIAQYEKNNEKLFYVPHILPYCLNYQDQYKYLLLEPLQVGFPSGFIPRGFFCSLVVHLLQCEHWRKIESDHNYINVITFIVNEDFYLRLQDKVYYLEIQVRHDKYCERRCMSHELEDLHKCLRETCKNLKLDHEKLKYGFLCCDDKRITVHIELNSTTKIFCTDCQNPYKMGPLHELWFEKVSFNFFYY